MNFEKFCRISLVWFSFFGLVAQGAGKGNFHSKKFLVSPKHLGFTQAEVAFSNVAEKRKFILSHDDLKVAVKTRTLPVVVGPNGRYYITDGHHWALAVTEIRKQLKADHQPELAHDLKVKVEVLPGGDFSDRSWSDFSEYLYKHHIGYFPQEVWRQYQTVDANGQYAITPKNLENLYRDHLGKSASDLIDNRGRGLMGMAMVESGIKESNWFVNYFEFYLFDRLEPKLTELGLDVRKFQSSLEIPKSWGKKVAEFLVTDKDAIDLMTHEFVSSALDPVKTRVLILDQINKYRKQLGLPEVDGSELKP